MKSCFILSFRLINSTSGALWQLCYVNVDLLGLHIYFLNKYTVNECRKYVKKKEQKLEARKEGEMGNKSLQNKRHIWNQRRIIIEELEQKNRLGTARRKITRGWFGVGVVGLNTV